MNLEVVSTILQDAGLGTEGKSLFMNFMPAGFGGILLRDGFGGTRIDPELPNLRTGYFMLVVRHADYETAKQMIANAMEVLTIEQRTEVDGVLFNYMRPRTEPLVFQPSPGNLVEMTTNIDCSYVLL